MAILIHKVQNDNTSQEKSFGKWYPRVVNLKTIDLDGLCEHIATHGSIFTPDVVTGVVKKFIGCIQELLLESHKVRLDGIGTFYLKPRMKKGVDANGNTIYGGADTAADLDLNSVEFSVGFTPDRSDNSNFLGPNISRKASRVNAATFKPFASSDGDGEGEQGGGNSGGGNTGGDNGDSVEEQP